jgi:hypothetical protein
VPTPPELLTYLERILARPAFRLRPAEAKLLQAARHATRWFEFDSRHRAQANAALADALRRAHAHGWLKRLSKRIVIEEVEPEDLRGWRDHQIAEFLTLIRYLPLADVRAVEHVLDAAATRTLRAIRAVLEARDDEAALLEFDELEV